MKIGGVMNNVGVLCSWDGNLTTVEYNGSAQNVVIPYASTNRYSSLILSGSGVKTMPAVDMSILGDLIVGGTASVTTSNDLVGNLTIGTTAILIQVLIRIL
jgi:hypothetical protein